MNENDLIAEYIKENHPEILNSADFALFKLKKAMNQFLDDLSKPFIETFSKIDFSKLDFSKMKVSVQEGENNDE